MLSLIVFFECCRLSSGLPLTVKTQMVCNILFDSLVGLVPVIGDLGDFFFHANMRNLDLLSHHIQTIQNTQAKPPIPLESILAERLDQKYLDRR